MFLAIIGQAQEVQTKVANVQGNEIITFANKEAGEKALKEQQEMFKNFVPRGFKSGEELPSDPFHPMYGLNQFVPAFKPDFDYDWYGSGDVDGNGVINMDDYNSNISGGDPFNDGTYRGDTDLDGVSGTANDKKIIYEYLTGKRTHINMWEHETVEEKIAHFKKAWDLDPTSEINAYSANWLCYDYTNQTFINFNGVHDIGNSTFSERNGPGREYDLTHNGIWRIPVNMVYTRTADETPHSINSVFLGSPENQDAREFSSKLWFEPQIRIDEGSIQEIGDYSLNVFGKEKKYVYFYNKLFSEWQSGERELVDYYFENGGVRTDVRHPDLVISWNSFKKVETEGDKDVEYEVGVENNYESLAGELSGLHPGTSVEKIITSGQIMDGTINQVNYDVDVLSELTAGAYNPQNTFDAVKNQTLRIRDNTKPVYNESTGKWEDNSGLELVVTQREESNQNPDPWSEGHYVYEKSTYEKATDVAGNESDERFVSTLTEDELPTGKWETFPSTYEIQGRDAPMPDTSISGKPTVSVTQDAPYSLTYKDGNTPVRQEELSDVYEREWKFFYATAADTLRRVQEIKKNSGVGIEEAVITSIKIYPNPVTDVLFLDLGNDFKGEQFGHLRVKLYLSTGELILSQIPDSRLIRIPLEQVRKGMLILHVFENNKSIFKTKVIKL